VVLDDSDPRLAAFDQLVVQVRQRGWVVAAEGGGCSSRVCTPTPLAHTAQHAPLGLLQVTQPAGVSLPRSGRSFNQEPCRMRRVMAAGMQGLKVQRPTPLQG
jgi:hypothetical protein